MISLEDFHEDILGKAMRGLGIGKNEMALRINMDRSLIESVLSGKVDEELIRLIFYNCFLILKSLFAQHIRNGVRLLRALVD